MEVSGRVRAAFNVEQATRRFFDRFKQERNVFEKFVQGIPDVDMTKWYVSVMLNRFMFVYFIQKKGFLNGDINYLRNRLGQMQRQYGNDRFYSFYRYFLLRLFHEGLGQPEHDAELEKLLGTVPYLNGGIFQLHEVERRYPDIQIADEAFEHIFDFFDQYQWHLDDRPLGNDREINPEVLGYIFEQYINQKQMGAYYTKEDITEYISKNTIIPFLFDAAQKDVSIAFGGEHSIWWLLQESPDRSIYPAMRKGTELELPPEIAAGIEDVSQRGLWNTPTPDAYALPTEIWRETVARRQRYEEVRAKLVDGEIQTINDFITYNLNIRQFAQDVIENCAGPETLRAFWKAINRVSVLDPTCGSGAFLFAALNILQPLYDACLERMRAFVAELGPDDHPQKYSDFKQVLDQISRHPNQDYFVLKSIVVNNLYGVDIMAEAVEIAKLRLFLKLVAQVDTVDEIEPLPDVDFNIRAGNTLVGFTTKEEVRRALEEKQVGLGAQQTRMVFGEEEAALAAIEERAADVDRLFNTFRQMQITGDLQDFAAQDFVATKQALHERLTALDHELNRAMALQYGIDLGKPSAYQKWVSSHQPFHWFTEFYGIMQKGGFDVIIGNPPYVSYNKVQREYTVRDYRTKSGRNLYALVTERSIELLPEDGCFGMILPIASVATQTMTALQERYDGYIQWHSHFAVRPGKLFVGVDMNLTITLLQKVKVLGETYSTGYNRWSEAEPSERPHLFETLGYIRLEPMLHHSSRYPKLGSSTESVILQRMLSHGKKLKCYFVPSGKVLYYHSGGRYWRKALPTKLSSHYKPITIPMSIYPVALALLNSQLFYWFWISHSNCMDVVSREVYELPVFDLVEADSEHFDALTERLLKSYYDAVAERERRGAQINTHELNFDVSQSKPVIDEIDSTLARYYGFTDYELDFIINYDIKYRMGDDLFDSENGDG